MDNYIPQVGDSVHAKRKVPSNIFANSIVGPVLETWDNACRIITNQGTEIESDFQLFYNDWTFRFLHKTCTHNAMVSNPEPGYAWKCADCGYVYGK